MKKIIWVVLVMAMLGLASNAIAAQSPQVPLLPTTIPQFVDPLPDLDVIVSGSNQIELQLREFKAMVLPANTVPGYSGTWVWGYLQPNELGRSSYIGPVIVANRGTPTELKFVNNLGTVAFTNVLAYKYSTDQTLHWADPLNNTANTCHMMSTLPAFGSLCAQNYDGPIVAAVHLHGGEVPPQLDGGPDSWFSSDGLLKGLGFYSFDGAVASNYAIYRYPNNQEGAPLWFHDHTLGATRLNVYAGLAGAYLLVDPLKDPANLPPLVPLVIQDRMFDTNGQLFFPADSAGGILYALNPEHPYWVPEFIGDTIVVNGKSWPYKSVEPKRYTFLFLNGSNARGYEMYLSDPVSGNNGPPIWIIGTDGGYLDNPVKIDPALNGKLLMLPGERYMAIIDFAGYQAGVVGPNGRVYSGNWLLNNTARAPYPGGIRVDKATTAKVMQFNVGVLTDPDTSFNPATVGITLRGGAGQGPAIVRLTNPTTGALAAGVTVQKTRQLTLNEVANPKRKAIDPVTGLQVTYPGGPVEILVNNTRWSGQRTIGASAGMFVMQPIPGFLQDFAGNYLSETPNEGETEVWEIVNLTMDAHPIHLHLSQFQLVNRQAFSVNAYRKAYEASFPGGGYDPLTGLAYPPGVYMPSWGPPLDYFTGNARALGGNPDIAALGKNGMSLYLQGAATPPLPNEAGWKDTIIAYPGQVTRIAVRWSPTDMPVNTPPAIAVYPFDPNGGRGYVWHCHIIDHEDNEMMRPSQIIPANASRSYIQGVDY